MKPSVEANRSSIMTIIPSYDEMIWPTLRALKELGDSGSNQEIEERAAALLGLSDSQLGLLHKDGPKTEVSYRMAWARTYLSKIEAVSSSGRAIWSITDYGRSISEEETRSIPKRVRLLYSEKSSTNPDFKMTECLDTDIPEEPESLEIEEQAEARDWREILLEVLQNLEPSGFERLCQRILRESGFTRVVVTGRSGDGGIDGVGVLRIALLSFQVFFQCKRYKGAVGSSAICDFRGAMVGRTDKGLFLTTGSFTPEAKREAARDGAPALDLIDGEVLCDLLKDLKLGVNTRMVEEVSIDPDGCRRFETSAM